MLDSATILRIGSFFWSWHQNGSMTRVNSDVDQRVTQVPRGGRRARSIAAQIGRFRGVVLRPVPNDAVWPVRVYHSRVVSGSGKELKDSEFVNTSFCQSNSARGAS